MQPVLVLLNRYEAEAARDEAREAARAIAAEAVARETARREAEALDATWRAALEDQRRTAFAVASEATPIIVSEAAIASVAIPSAAEPNNPVGAILDALPDQILAWYRTEAPIADPKAEAATEAVLNGLEDSLLDQFRASRISVPLAFVVSESDKAARIAA